MPYGTHSGAQNVTNDGRRLKGDSMAYADGRIIDRAFALERCGMPYYGPRGLAQ